MNLLRRAGAWLRARMIDDAHRAWKFASVRLAALGLFLPEIWNAVPGDLRAQLPDPWPRLIMSAMFAAVIFGRMAKKADHNG